jgi:hypothetical protein
VTTSEIVTAKPRRPRLLAGTMLAAALALPLAAPAQQTTARLLAVSKTATAITGDLVVRTRHGAAVQIVFTNGTTMKLTGGDDGVYRAVGFGNPVLLNRNRLCGKASVKRVTLTEGRDGMYTMSVYDADAMHAASLCATFTYATK